MTNNLVTHIDGKFGGEAIRFELKRENLIALENTLGGSAFQTLKRLTANAWTMHEVQTVISAGIPEAIADRDDSSVVAQFAKLDTQLVAVMGGSARATVFDSRRVIAVLRDNPPAIYAVLAQLILEAALFGIDPENATFDEGAA